MKKPIPVIGLAGYSGAGKTTILEKLIRELKGRGYRIGVIKHTHHQVDFDRPGKDSWRHCQAGADVVALAAPTGVSLIRKYAADPGPAEVIALIDDVDLIIIEGYKHGQWPRIEIFRHNVMERPFIPSAECLAVVSDVALATEAPCYGPDDIEQISDLIESKFLS